MTRSMPSAYTSNGTGRCCQRKFPPSLLTARAAGPIIFTASGLDLTSAADSRLVFSGFRTMPRDCANCEARLSGFLMFGPGLQHPAGAAQQGLQPAQLAGLRVGRRQGAGAAHLTVELVEEQLHRRHPDEAGAQRLGEHALHLRLLASGRALVFAGGAVQTHCGRAHVGVAEESRDIRAQRPRLECRDVLLAVGPGLVPVHGVDDMLARDRLDPAEDVAGVHPVDVDRRQRARPEHHRGDTVTQRLRQRRAAEHLDVVVGVNVEHAGQHPLAAGIDHLRAVRLVEVAVGDRDDHPVADAEGAHRRRRAGAVEPPAIADDRVVAHVGAHNAQSNSARRRVSTKSVNRFS